MSDFLYDSDEVPAYDPMEAYDLSMRADCVPPNFSLNPSEATSAQAMATFDLTPASGDGMIFNLTPVSEAGVLSLTSVDQAETGTSSGLDSLGLGYDRLLQTEIGSVAGVAPMYTKEFSNTISAMTFSPPPTTSLNTSPNQINFSPPIQVSSSGNLTPDFTGLLPPPPPSLQERSNSRPPPQLLAMASEGHPDQPHDLPHYSFSGSRSIVEAYRPTISTPSPAVSPISGTSPLSSPRPHVSPGPPLYSLPRSQQSPRPLQLHQLQPNPPPLELKNQAPAISPKSQLSQLLQAPTQPASTYQAPKLSTFPSPSYPPTLPSPKMSSLPSPTYPPPSPSHPAPKQAPKMSPLPSPSYPPHPSPTYQAPKEPSKVSSFPSPSYPPPQASPKSHQQFPLSSQQYSNPPPPYKSPPYPSSFYPPEHPSLLSSALQPPSTQDFQPQMNPQMSPTKSSLQLAPSVTLTKKQKAQPPKSPVKSPPPFPYSSSHSPQHSLPSYPHQYASAQPNSTLQPPPPLTQPQQPFLKQALSPTQGPPTQPPPPYSASGQPKLPSYSLDELKDLPGVNLKKSTVDLNTYVNTVVQNRHPHFANIDGFAERCLACIVRKIRSNLPTLKALEAISLCGRGSQTDPGCVLIPRMKDGRITIARPGGGAGGTKKIHPHLALVQIFKNPSVVNHNSLVSSPHCAAPFIAKGEGEGEMVCISPLHYHVDTQKVKSPSTPKKKPPVNSQTPTHQLNSANVLLNHIRAMDQQKMESLAPIDTQQEIAKLLGTSKMEGDLTESMHVGMKQIVSPKKQTVASKEAKRSVQEIGSDSDFLSDSEDEIDWVKKWEEERIQPTVAGVQEFNEDELVKEVEVLAIKKGELGKEELVPAEKQLVDRLKVMEGFMDLVNGKYDMEPLKTLQKPKPKKSESKKQLKLDKQVPTVRKKPGPKPKKKIGEAWISDPSKVKLSSGEKQKHQEPKFEDPGAAAYLARTSVQHVVKEEPVQHKEEEKDEAVIQNLLEDIKGSFESQFEMDLETFGRHEEPSFSNQDFAMTNAFNLSSLDELSKDSFVGQPVLTSGVTSGSSDAMFGGVGAGLELPGLVASWEDKEEVGHREQPIQYSQEQENSFRQQEMSFSRSHDDLSQDMSYARENQNINFREQPDLFSGTEPEDLTFGHREPEDLTFSHRQPEALTFGHREPEDLTFNRPPADLTFAHTEPEDLTFGHRGSEQAGSQYGSSAFLSAGTISQEQFLNMFDQD